MSFTLSSGSAFSDNLLLADSPPAAQKGIGCYLLWINLHMDVKAARGAERMLTDLRGSLHYSGKFVAEVFPERAALIRSFFSHGIPNTPQLCATLSRSTIEEIERTRDSTQDVSFDLKLSGLVVPDLAKIDPGSSNQPEVVNDTLKLNISQTEWIKFLKTWQYQEILLLEVPLGTSNETSATSYLKTAHDLFLKGHWESCVSECRKALENLRIGINPTAKLNELLANRKKNSADERALVLLLATVDICSPASHADENAESIVWRRNDAEIVLHYTAASVRRLLAR
ncbi:MAG: hypothetical protein M9962_08680 [Oligoflexia bacterium]|nr:hypothetical protein [Oligoflexia bacterium]